MYPLILSVLSLASAAGDLASQYSAIDSDVTTGGNNVTAVSQSLALPTASWVLLESHGRVFPHYCAATAAVSVWADGTRRTNTSVVDWSQSTNALQHSYNVVGAVFLNAGPHTISLVAESINSQTFRVGAQSNLISLVEPSDTVTTSTLGADSSVLNFNTNGPTPTSILPMTTFTSVNVDGANGMSVIVLASERNYLHDSPRDPLATIALDGASFPNDVPSWSDNDLGPQAENQASFFSHAFLSTLSSNNHTLSIAVSELPYSGNNVTYQLGGDAKIVALQGADIFGSAPLSSDARNVANYLCIATSMSYAGCPNVGTSVLVASGEIKLPQGGSGIVLILGKTRIQADSLDLGGSVSLFLKIDGVRKGSTGVQELASPSSESTRTMSTSFLTAGSSALTPGAHHVELYAKATGSFRHLSVTKDLPLIWFN